MIIRQRPTRVGLNLVLVLGDGGINSVNGVYFDGEELSLIPVNPGDGIEFVNLRGGVDVSRTRNIAGQTFRGGRSQTNLSRLTEFQFVPNGGHTAFFSGIGVPNWTATDKLTGIAYAMVGLRRSSAAANKLNHIPNITFDVSGRKVYDPRITTPNAQTTVWSNNPALCIRDYLTHKNGLNIPNANKNLDGQLNNSDNLIDDESFIEAANICDLDPNTGITSTTEGKRLYTLDGVVSLDQNPISILDGMLSSCNGELVWTQGKYRLQVGWKRVAARTFNINSKDLRGDITTVTSGGRSTRFNAMRGQFISEENNYLETDFSPYVDSSAVTEDGQQIFQDIQLPFTSQNRRAHRIAVIRVRESRRSQTVVFECNQNAQQIAVNDWISPSGNLLTKFPLVDNKSRFQQETGTVYFQVTRITQRSDGGIDISARAFSDDIYNNLPTDIVIPSPPPPNPPSPPSPVTPPTNPPTNPPSGGSSTLSGLTDTTITNPQNNQVLTWNGSAWINANPTGGSSGTGATYEGIVTPSTRYIDFTGISTTNVKRITILFEALDPDNNNYPAMQIGDSGGLETTGYIGETRIGSNTRVDNFVNWSSNIVLADGIDNGDPWTGKVVLTRLANDDKTWIITVQGDTEGSIRNDVNGSGRKTLDTALDRIRILHNSDESSYAFVGGKVNVLLETGVGSGSPSGGGSGEVLTFSDTTEIDFTKSGTTVSAAIKSSSISGGKITQSSIPVTALSTSTSDLFKILQSRTSETPTWTDVDTVIAADARNVALSRISASKGLTFSTATTGGKVSQLNIYGKEYIAGSNVTFTTISSGSNSGKISISATSGVTLATVRSQFSAYVNAGDRISRTLGANGEVTLSADRQITSTSIVGSGRATVSVTNGIATISVPALPPSTDFDRDNIYTGSGLTKTASGSDGVVLSSDPEFIRDTIGTTLQGTGSISLTVNDSSNTITISSNARTRAQVKSDINTYTVGGNGVTKTTDGLGRTVFSATPTATSTIRTIAQSAFVAGTNVTFTTSANGQVRIDSTGGGSPSPGPSPGGGFTRGQGIIGTGTTISADPEFIRDTVGLYIQSSGAITLTKSDSGDRLTIGLNTDLLPPGSGGTSLITSVSATPTVMPAVTNGVGTWNVIDNSLGPAKFKILGPQVDDFVLAAGTEDTLRTVKGGAPKNLGVKTLTTSDRMVYFDIPLIRQVNFVTLSFLDVVIPTTARLLITLNPATTRTSGAVNEAATVHSGVSNSSQQRIGFDTDKGFIIHIADSNRNISGPLYLINQGGNNWVLDYNLSLLRSNAGVSPFVTTGAGSAILNNTLFRVMVQATNVGETTLSNFAAGGQIGCVVE